LPPPSSPLLPAATVIRARLRELVAGEGAPHRGRARVSPCSTAFDRAAGGDGQWSIGFGIDAESKKAQNATLTWWIQDPSVGFIDFGDDVCNVAEIWHPLASEQQKQTVALAQFAGKAPFTLHFDGDTQFTEDSLGHPATLAYDWTYDITLQRVDDQGNPLG
jgi:hypothetical protein